jgi:hypothetical protein
MKVRLEQVLHLGTAAINIAAPFGLDPVIAGLLLAVISLGLALCAGLRQ